MRTEISQIDLSGEIPPEMLSKNASNDMLLFTSFLSILIGGILFYLGKRGKQLWMQVWSIGLVLISLFTAGAIVFGLDGLG